MVRRGIFTKLFFSLFILVAILSTFAHFVVFDAGVFGLTEEGISGFTIGKLAVGEGIQEGYPISAPLSGMIVLVEWLAVIVVVIIIYVKGKVEFSRDYKELKTRKERMKGSRSTDLDKLYELLKEKKKIKLGVVSKAFNVNENIVKVWAKTLESGRLAEVNYPRMGDAEIVLKEKG